MGTPTQLLTKCPRKVSLSLLNLSLSITWGISIPALPTLRNCETHMRYYDKSLKSTDSQISLKVRFYVKFQLVVNSKLNKFGRH